MAEKKRVLAGSLVTTSRISKRSSVEELLVVKDSIDHLFWINNVGIDAGRFTSGRDCDIVSGTSPQGSTRLTHLIMSSGFVSGGTTEAPIERDDEWLKAQQDIEATRRRKEEQSRQKGGKTLYEVLQSNKGD